MVEHKEYLTPFLSFGEGEFCEKRSRFLSCAFQVRTAEEVSALLDKTRARYKDANHHCYAYRLKEGSLIRFSDDGEPQGTAGRPILAVITGEGLEDVLIIVTRYFGGTLLGAGGLARAYTKGAKIALEAVGIARMSPYLIFRLVCPYELVDAVKQTAKACQAQIEEACYTERVTFRLSLPEKQEGLLLSALAEGTCGRVSAERVGTGFRPVKIK